MKKERIFGLLAIAATFLFAGCSGSVETGPVPTITPRPTVTPVPTPTPVVVVQEDENNEVSVYETKKYKEYYEKENKLPQLKLAYEDVFSVGMDVLLIDVTDEKRAAIIKEQFNTIGIKRDLMPENTVDYEAAKASADKTRIPLNLAAADAFLKFAKDNNLKVTVPRLLTNSFPAWVFTRDFDESQVVEITNEDGTTTTTVEFADVEVVTARMENYFKDIITYCNDKYPGVVISWEVLDDPINASESHELKYSSNYWLQTIGDEYIVKACEFARKYATTEQKLLVSQDALDELNTLKPSVTLYTLLKEKGIVDGVAIQAHYSPNSPTVFNMEDMVKALHDTGLEIHFTEYYADSNSGNREDLDKTAEELLALGVKRNKALMTNILNYETKKNYDIKSITFESLTNDNAEVNQPKDYVDHLTLEVKYGVQIEGYPSMFNADLGVSEVFFAIIGDATVKAY